MTETANSNRITSEERADLRTVAERIRDGKYRLEGLAHENLGRRWFDILRVLDALDEAEQVIAGAPHGLACRARWFSPDMQGDPIPETCNCWKAQLCG